MDQIVGLLQQILAELKEMNALIRYSQKVQMDAKKKSEEAEKMLLNSLTMLPPEFVEKIKRLEDNNSLEYNSPKRD